MMPRRKRRWLWILAALVAVAGGLDHAGVFGRRGDDRRRYDRAQATITHIIDGNTICVDIPDRSSAETRVVLRGIACPALASKPGDREEYFAREAADFVQEHFEGMPVLLLLDPNRGTRDENGDLLAYVQSIETGECLNELLVSEGLAYADARRPHVFEVRYRELERRARRQRCGLWLDITPDKTPAWRRSLEPSTQPAP